MSDPEKVAERLEEIATGTTFWLAEFNVAAALIRDLVRERDALHADIRMLVDYVEDEFGRPHWGTLKPGDEDYTHEDAIRDAAARLDAMLNADPNTKAPKEGEAPQ